MSSEDNTLTSKQPAQATLKKKPRIVYQATVDYEELKKLKGTILDSFIRLVQRVILIDGIKFTEYTYENFNGKRQSLKLDVGRRKEFLRLIRQYSALEFDGIKCHVLDVYDEEEQKQVKDIHLQKLKDIAKLS